MYLRRPVAALAAFYTLIAAGPAAAQMAEDARIGPVDRPSFLITPRSRGPEFRMDEGDLRRVGEPRRNGLIAAVPLNRNLEVGVGRFRVSDMAQPRSYTESDRNPVSMGIRQRSIAGIGFNLRFD